MPKKPDEPTVADIEDALSTIATALNANAARHLQRAGVRSTLEFPAVAEAMYRGISMGLMLAQQVTAIAIRECAREDPHASPEVILAATLNALHDMAKHFGSDPPKDPRRRKNLPKGFPRRPKSKG